MKKYFHFLIIAVLFFTACKEEYIGQYPIDNVPPKPISNPVVENFQGKSIITYQLPDETDLLYVKAVYTSSSGNQEEVKASSFTNSLIVAGFGKSLKTTVQLISVDRSQNESEPVPVQIEPEDSPIYAIRNSIVTEASWGGFRISWNNPLRENIVVGVMKKNDEGIFGHIENFYSSVAEAENAVRGQDSIRSDFAVYVRDTYNNYTDTVFFTLQPWYEQQLDKGKFVGLPKSSKFTLHSYGSTNMNVMWDDIFSVDNSIYYIATGSQYYPYFAFDLGVKVKLSRFRYWTRRDYIFRLHHPKKIQIFGTNDPNVANNSESDDSEWILLNDEIFESFRPSGLQPDEDPTTEDRAYHDAGEEFEFPLGVPAVRYLRFKSLQSWTGVGVGDGCFVSELTFWGGVPEN